MNLTEAVAVVLQFDNFRKLNFKLLEERDDVLIEEFAEALWKVLPYSDSCYNFEPYISLAENRLALELENKNIRGKQKRIKLLIADARLAKQLNLLFKPYYIPSRNIIKESAKLLDRPKAETIAQARELIEVATPDEINSNIGLLKNLAVSIGLVIDEFYVDGRYCFSRVLFGLIGKHDLDEVELYKKAGISRQQFSRFRKIGYVPQKETIFSLIIAMKLDFWEADELLNSAGYVFTPGIKMDMMIEYFIKHELYDIDTVNYILHVNNLTTLGSKTRVK